MTDDQLLQRPIIIIGAPRSGTTLLGQVLSQHRALCYLEEPRLTWRFGNDGKSDLLRRDDARPEVIRHIRATFAQRVRAAGRERLLEKTPSNALRLPFVDSVFPDARYIHIIRNGEDSVLSILRFWEEHAHGTRKIAKGRITHRLREVDLRRLPYYAKEVLRRVAPSFLRPIIGRNIWGPRIPGIDGLVKELDPIEVCCLQWRMCVELACHHGRQLPADRYFECRLEDLSEAHLRRILTFCELAEAPAMFDYFRREFDSSAPRGRVRNANAAHRRQIISWIAPTMHWLGYDP